MRTFAFLVLLFLLGLAVLLAQPSDYQSLRMEAEKFYAEGSYSRAQELYEKARSLPLSSKEARWVDFRLADTRWRSQAATETADPTKFEQAQRQLETLVRDIVREEDRDQIWAEVHESLGDFYWTRRDSRNWSQAWPYYEKTLDWWAVSSDLQAARQRYLKIVWTASRPQWVEPYYYYGYYGNFVPLPILENALRIAITDTDKARAHYLIAMTLRNQGGDYTQRQRIPDEFEAAITASKTTDWYDDALYFYAEWLSNYGRIILMENGQWRQEPDYVKALALYRRLLSEHVKGESRYYDQAKEQSENITRQVVGVNVSNIFLPDSEIQVHLQWRNTKRIELALYRIDLTHDTQFIDKDMGAGTWLQQVNLKGKAPLKSWSKETQDKGDYKPGQEMMRRESKLDMGAYIIEATGGTAKGRDLILVTA